MDNIAVYSQPTEHLMINSVPMDVSQKTLTDITKGTEDPFLLYERICNVVFTL